MIKSPEKQKQKNSTQISIKTLYISEKNTSKILK